MKFVQWFLRRRFLNFVNVFLLFCNYLPLEKGGALHLNKLESPSPKDALCQGWMKLAQWFLRRRRKCEKFTTTTITASTMRTDIWEILIRKAHLSLELRWVKKLQTTVQIKKKVTLHVWIITVHDNFVCFFLESILTY